jgi:hypothetical protein
MCPTTYFETPAQELAATQAATVELLQSVAASGETPDTHTIYRLNRLAATCARLAFSNELPLGESVRALITWCDHLDDSEWTANFMLALKRYPLQAPW